jgi:two-component sensor histidine kinase/putative methionine-R-sulfoxide reductase with GAF domain
MSKDRPKRNNSRVQKVQRQQTALARFGAYAFREPELQSILTEAARLSAEGLGVQFCKVLKYRPEQNDLIVEAGVGWQVDVVGRSISEANASSPGGRAFVRKEPVITRDLREKHDFVLPPIYADHRIVSSVNVPVQGTGERLYGVLEVDSEKVERFDKQDTDFLIGFANVLAEAVATAERIAELRASIKQKDSLARELQHRVRNNLQIVYRMLDREARHTNDPDAKRGIQGVARRVIILGHVYEHLLGLGLTATIDFGEYLRSLCETLADFYEAQYSGVKLTVEADDLRLDVDTTTTLGMVVNELVTNSYEHAFAEQGRGKIEVVVRHMEGDSKALLIVSDSGPGFVEQADSDRNGLSLVRGLVKQAQGTVNVQSDGRVIWTVTLPVRTPVAAK